MVIAYLRVSTEKQFLANQKEEIMRFAEKNGLSIDKWYTETVSGSVSTKDRKLSELLKRMQSRGYTDCNGDFEIEPYTARDYDYPEFLY